MVAVAEIEHLFLVQLSSILALLASIIALLEMGPSLRKFSPGRVKTAMLYLFVQTILLSLSIVFMATYHVLDIDIAMDLWHMGALLSLFIGIVVTLQIIHVCRMFK